MTNIIKDAIESVDEKLNHRHKFKYKLKKNFLRRKTLIIFIVLLLVGASIAKAGLINNKETNTENKIIDKTKTVQTLLVGGNDKSLVSAVGTVRAESKINVVALTRGTVRNIYFQVGDNVPVGMTLANLYNSTSLTTLINAETTLANLQNNLILTKSITAETIRQSELSVRAAEEAVAAAEIGLKTAKDSFLNYEALKDKSNIDTKNNAVISFAGHLNTVFNVLDQINYIFKIEGTSQLPGIDKTLGVKNLSSINIAKNDYRLTKDQFNAVNSLSPSSETISSSYADLVNLLLLTKRLVDDTIIVLDNTVTSADFTNAMLTLQKNNFIALRSTVVGAQAIAETTHQTLENLSLVNNREKDSLANAVSAAENRLNTAKTNYNNSLTGLENTRFSVESQILSAQIAVDNARSNLNLAHIQTGDLRITSPISGTITETFVELGAEVNPGGRIAEISKTNLLKIEIDLPAADAIKIKPGQPANINNNLKGTVNRIYPTADSTSKKVRVEIIFDNANKELVAESFADIKIPIADSEVEARASFFVPLKAVVISPNENYAFKIVPAAEPGKYQAQKITVKLGKTEGTLVEILSGLSKNDEIAVEGNRDLEDGEIVEVTRQ